MTTHEVTPVFYVEADSEKEAWEKIRANLPDSCAGGTIRELKEPWYSREEWAEMGRPTMHLGFKRYGWYGLGFGQHRWYDNQKWSFRPILAFRWWGRWIDGNFSFRPKLLRESRFSPPPHA